MLENIAISLEGIWAHKMRSLLTMLGIIIGIASIITIVSTIRGTNEQIKENLIGAGNNVVTVRLTQEGGSEYQFEWQGNPLGVTPVTEETLAEIEELAGVSGAALFHSRTYVDGVYWRNTAYNGTMYGVDSRYFDVCGYHVVAGRSFLPGDFERFAKVCVLESATATKLIIGEEAVGSTIEIKGEPFTVVGIVERSSASGPTITSLADYEMYAGRQTGAIFITDAAWPVAYSFDEPYAVAVAADSTDDMTRVGKSAADVLNEAHVTSSAVAYEAEDLLEQAANMQELANSTNRQLIWIAGISLLVGGIGVMNIMMVSVTERTREIGLKKALGARRRRILGQFLTEAAVLTAIGGVLGVLAGIGFAKMLSAVMGTPTAISAGACVIAVTFSTLIGLVFGLAPAVKASKLNPIEALNRE